MPDDVQACWVYNLVVCDYVQAIVHQRFLTQEFEARGMVHVT